MGIGALGGVQEGPYLIGCEGLNLVGPRRGNRYPVHWRGGQRALGNEPAKQGSQVTVVRVDGTRSDRAYHARVTPTPAGVLMAVRAVREEGAKLDGSARFILPLSQEPQ